FDHTGNRSRRRALCAGAQRAGCSGRPAAGDIACAWALSEQLLHRATPCARSDQELKVERGENGEDCVQPCGRIAGLDQRDRFLAQASLCTEFALAEAELLALPPNGGADLPGAASEVVHGRLLTSSMRHFRYSRNIGTSAYSKIMRQSQ